MLVGNKSDDKIYIHQAYVHLVDLNDHSDYNIKKMK